MFRLLTFLVVLVTGMESYCQADLSDKWRDSANVWLKKKDYARAAPFLDSIQRYDPDDVDVYNIIVAVNNILERYPKALSATRELMRLEPDKIIHWSNAGWYALLSGNLAKAQYYLKNAIKKDPSNFNNYLNLGHVFACKENSKKMFYYYTYAVEFSPDPSNIKNIAEKDIRLLKKLKLFPYKADEILGEFEQVAGAYTPNVAATKLLDSIQTSIYIHNEQPGSEKVLALMKQFCREEMKNKFWRYLPLAAFEWQIGVQEMAVRNEIRAVREHLSASLAFAKVVPDTVFLIERYIDYAKRLNDDNRLLRNEMLDTALSLAGKNGEPFLLLEVYWAKANINMRLYWDSVLHNARQAYRLLQQMPSLDADDLEHGIETALFLTAEQLSDVYMRKKRCDSSIYFLDQSVAYVKKHEPTAKNLYLAANNKAVLLYKCERIREAVKLGLETLEIYKADKQIDRYHLTELVATCYLDLKDTSLAERYFKIAIDTYKKFVDEPGNKSVLLNVRCEAAIKALKLIYAARRETESLFSISEMAKQSILYRSLSNSLYPKQTLSLKEVQHKLSEHEAILSFTSSGRMNWGYGIGATKNSTKLMVEDSAKLTALLSDQRFAELRRELNEFAVKVMQFSGRTTGYSEDIFTAQLGYISLIFNNSIGNTKGVRGFTLMGAKNDARKKKEELVSMNDVLYQLYVAPFESILAGKRTLYISAENATNYFPFEVLKNPEGRYLGEMYNIIYVPSFTLNALLEKRPEASRSLLGIGNPLYSQFKATQLNGRAYDLSMMGYDNWSDLPGTKEELSQLASLGNDITVLQEASVSETSLKNMSLNGELRTFKFLHFATHGMVRLDQYEDNSLIVTEQKPSVNDGFLQFWEITDLDIRARLVCLSACETAVSGFVNNNDLNLPVAFLMAGAKSVLASSWKIDDKATSLFMADFYRNIFAGLTVPDALYKTRKKFITGEFGEQYKSPQYWGAFKYTGY